MRVDRAAFLTITGLLAAGCNNNRPAVSPTIAAEPPPQAAPVAASAPVEAAAAPTGPTLSVGPTEVPPAVPQAASPAPEPAPAAPLAARGPIPPPRPNRKSLGLENGCGKGKVSFDASRQSCNDEQGAETDCVDIVSSGVYPTTESGRCPGAAAAQRRCNVYSRYFKPRLAHEAGECLKKATGKACDGCKFFRCGHESLMTACVDHSADYDCGVINSLCADVSKNRCLSYLSGMNQQGRDAMVECLKKDCTRGFLRCLESVK
jgi:hypothetical protein